MLAHLKSSFICICQKRTTCLPASVPHWPRTSFPSNCRRSSTPPSSPTFSNTPAKSLYERQTNSQVSVVLFSVKLSRLNCSWSPAEPQIIVSSHGTINKQASMEGIFKLSLPSLPNQTYETKITGQSSQRLDTPVYYRNTNIKEYHVKYCNACWWFLTQQCYITV